MVKSLFVKVCVSILVLLALTACAYRNVSVCRHSAVNVAILHKAEHPQDKVRICLGWTTSKKWHAQAKFKPPGGDWVFLKQYPAHIISESSEQDNFEIKEVFTIEKWLKNYLKVLDKSDKN